MSCGFCLFRWHVQKNSRAVILMASASRPHGVGTIVWGIMCIGVCIWMLWLKFLYVLGKVQSSKLILCMHRSGFFGPW